MTELRIGIKIEETRKKRGLTLRETAKQAEMTPSMLSQIEKGHANPSIQSLKSLANVLDVPVFTFLMEEINMQELVVRKQDRTHMTVDGVHYELVSPDFTSSLATAIMRLVPGHASSAQPLSHKGEEVAYVLEGALTLELAGEVFHLTEGDSVKIPAHVVHKWENKSDREASILFSVTPPSF